MLFAPAVKPSLLSPPGEGWGQGAGGSWAIGALGVWWRAGLDKAGPRHAFTQPNTAAYTLGLRMFLTF